ncbi:hypothetical protein [Mangrovicella endophytica]|uniref:hypothetical protein n=1 Tax=Mangrovicella endophytica TaxID=2066697 RepID=UPI000C9DF24A|nr:hypothetical protein [Mangrovicella endophytica]
MPCNNARSAVGFLILSVAGLSLAGCVGPTYGTGRSQGETLFDDMNNLVALGGDDKEAIDYSPRAALVKPSTTTVLPPPQESRSSTADPRWPESPEARTKRIRENAYQGDDDTPIPANVMTARKEGITDDRMAAATTSRTGYRMQSDNADTTLSPDELKSGSELVRQRIKERNQGSPTQRKYLSEPPLTYRQAATTAPANDPGVDEDVKAARLKRNSDSLGAKLKSLLPF